MFHCVTFVLKVILFFSICISCSAVPLNKHDEQFRISIIHFSDFHARFVEVSPSAGLCYEKDECVGGISRIATIVEKLRRTRPNPIFLNAGDCFQGTLYYDLFKINITAHFFNKLNFDAYTIGNHDFDENVTGFVSFAKQLNSPIVTTNIDYSEEPSMQNIYTNSTIIRRGNRYIGLIGVINSDTDKISTTTGKIKFLDEVDTINLEVKKLKARGIDIVIVLSHCGIEHDKIIANSCPDIFKLFYNGKPPSGEAVYGEYPVVVNQKDTNRKVLIIHSGAFTKYMGDLEVSFDAAGEISAWKGNPIYLDSSIIEDSSFLKDLEPWTRKVDHIGKRKLTTSLAFLNASCYTGECTLANLITDAMVHSYREQATISLLPAFYMKNSISEGSILYEDIYAMVPMTKPKWHLIELRGIDLLQVLENNVDASSNGPSFKNPDLVHWSGVKVAYNLRKQKSKVVSVKVRCKDGRFETLNMEEWYRIVVPQNMLSKTFPAISTKHRMITTGKIRDIDNLVQYLEKKEFINFTIESRMVFV